MKHRSRLSWHLFWGLSLFIPGTSQIACVSKHVAGSYYYESAYVYNRIDIKQDSSFSFYANNSLSKSRTAGKWYRDGADLILNSYDTFFPARVTESEVGQLRDSGQILLTFIDEYGEPVLSDSIGLIFQDSVYTTRPKNTIRLPDVPGPFILFYNSLQLKCCRQNQCSNKFIITAYEHPDCFYLQRKIFSVQNNRLMEKGSDDYYKKQ